jgi:hypothetical protein
MDENEIRDIATVVFLDKEGNEIGRTLYDAHEYRQVLSANTVAIWWDVDDILLNAERGDVKWMCLHCAQVILSEVIYRHDATMGISWDTIEYYKGIHKGCDKDDKDCRYNNVG